MVNSNPELNAHEPGRLGRNNSFNYALHNIHKSDKFLRTSSYSPARPANRDWIPPTSRPSQTSLRFVEDGSGPVLATAPCGIPFGSEE